MATDLRAGDTGTLITESLTDTDEVVVDLTLATDVSFTITSPAGVTTALVGEVVGDPTSGTVGYTTAEDDFDAAGVWKCQFGFSLPSGRWYAEVFRLRVGETLVETP